MYKKKGRPYKLDYDLVKICQDSPKYSKAYLDAAYELWDKYELFRKKMKFQLLSVAKRNKIDVYEEFESWDGYFWEKFVAQMDGQDLSKTPRETFKIYIRLQGYAMSLNRDIIHGRLKILENETSAEVSTSQDGETVNVLDLQQSKIEVDESDDIKALARKLFWEAYRQLTEEMSPTQKKFFKLREEGVVLSKAAKAVSAPSNIAKAITEAQKIKFYAILDEKAKSENMTCKDVLMSLQ